MGNCISTNPPARPRRPVSASASASAPAPAPAALTGRDRGIDIDRAPPSYDSLYGRPDADGPSAPPAPVTGDPGRSTEGESCLDLLTRLTFDATAPMVPATSEIEVLRAMIFTDPEIAEMTREPRDTCFDCALRVQVMLNFKGIRNATRGLFIWNGTSDEAPENHFATLARVAGQTWVIDPSAAQFPACQPMVEPPEVWAANIAAASFGKAVKFRDFPNVAQAGIAVNPLFRGCPLDFEGRVLNAPDWYRRIVKAPAEFRAIRQRQAEQENAALQRRLKTQARLLRKARPSAPADLQHRLFPPNYRELRRKP